MTSVDGPRIRPCVGGRVTGRCCLRSRWHAPGRCATTGLGASLELDSKANSHGSNGSPSSEHSNVTSGSLDENVKIALEQPRRLERRVQLDERVRAATSRAAARTSRCRWRGVGSTCSARSTARTSNVCVPGASSKYSCGLPHSTQSSSSVLSRRHSKPRSTSGVVSSVPMNVKSALWLLLGSIGRRPICGVGCPGGYVRSRRRRPSTGSARRCRWPRCRRRRSRQARPGCPNRR